MSKWKLYFLIPFIPFIVFGTQFAQKSTNVIAILVYMEGVALMNLTHLLVLVLMAILGLGVKQVSYEVESNYMPTYKNTLFE